MKNTIAERIFDFLKGFPPFDILDNQQLIRLSSQVKVVYLEKDSFIFNQNDQPHSHFYVVKDGAIGLYREMEEEKILVDICDEGDVFGLRPLIQDDHYLMSAKANEESIVYSISVEILQEITASNEKVKKYLTASFSTNIKTPYARENNGELFANVESLQSKESNYSDVQLAKYSPNPIVCGVEATIREAAQLMAENRVGSILIVENSFVIGIITDKDFRFKVATGIQSIDEKVTTIMSSPVLTYPPNLTVAEAQIAMVKNQITHLCITESGSVESPLIGIMSEHDIVVLHGNSPSVLIKELSRSKSVEDLKYIRKQASVLLTSYMEQNVPMDFVSNIMADINDLITQKAIDFSLVEMDSVPPCDFAWMALGSQGRKEQLLITDQDNALIYADPLFEEEQKTADYFQLLATKVTTILNDVGYEFCPAEMMASNPKWCISISEWRDQFHHWISTPTEDAIMMCTIFFDFNRVYGTEELIVELGQSIFESIESHEIFMNFLGRNALLNPPPLSFFKQFIVEHNGEHKNQFDLKGRALMPLIDGARLLTLHHKIPNKNNTVERLRALANQEPENKDLFESCMDAFRILSRFRTKQGLAQSNSGRYVELKTLSKTEKLKLKGCFKSIKDLQDLIKMRFNLAQMM